jgi:hypothetical protein
LSTKFELKLFEPSSSQNNVEAHNGAFLRSQFPHMDLKINLNMQKRFGEQKIRLYAMRERKKV